MLNAIVHKNIKRENDDRSHLVTLEEYYGHKEPIY